MHMKKSVQVLMLLTALAVFLSCGSSQSKVEAEGKAELLYGEISSGYSDKVLDIYSPIFYENTSRERWSKNLNKILSVAGEYESSELIDWWVSRNLKEKTRVKLVYRVDYSNLETIEELSFLVSGRNVELVGHHISSDQLLLDDSDSSK